MEVFVKEMNRKNIKEDWSIVDGFPCRGQYLFRKYLGCD